MRKLATDSMITGALRQLDPAPKADLTEAELARADAAFARILKTPSDAALSAEPERPRRRRARLLGAVGLIGAAGAVIPVLLLGGGSAYGSWTPTPEPLTAEAAAAAATSCRAALEVPDLGERVAVAEQRGEWTYMMLTGPESEATCLMPADSVGQDAADRGGFFGTYTPDPAAPPALATDGLDEHTSGDGSTDEGWFVWANGFVGSDVTGVTVHTSTGLALEASVVGNRFAVWWPSTEPSSDHPSETWSYTVHLTDGSARRVS